MNSLFILLFAAICLLLSACDRDTHDHPGLVTGKQLFNYHCAECHQETGKGKFLKGVPSNSNTGLSPSQISHKIVAGGKLDSKMPMFPNMPTLEVIKISRYVKSLR